MWIINIKFLVSKQAQSLCNYDNMVADSMLLKY